MSSNANRLLVIGLDAFDPQIGQQLIGAGELPNLARLQSCAHCFRIQPHEEKFTGLVWEQFSSGRRPEESRWSANTVDTDDYVPDQLRTRVPPFTQALQARTVVFDVPYFDLSRSPRTSGVVAWGSHDPGVPQASSPKDLFHEITNRFGPYPASKYIYGQVWHNPAETQLMANAIIAAVNVRSEVTRWLFTDRLPAWDLAMTVISEYHSASEALWHGWDEAHPLHSHASAKAAREGMLGVYRQADLLLGRLLKELPDARVLTFSHHGMGRNVADVPAMLLVPELIYRHFTGEIAFEPDESWPLDGTGGPNWAASEDWSCALNGRIKIRPRRSRCFWKTPVHSRASTLDWMPAARYRTAWPYMRAYAIPSFYDGRIRVNLKGRESRGIVPIKRYDAVIDEVVELISDCLDPITGSPLEISIVARPGNPFRRHASDADLMIRFNKDYYGFRSKKVGLVGPAPCRRTGGHEGGFGTGYYLTRRGRQGSDLGTFPAIDISAAVSALVNKHSGASPLGAALLRVSDS